MPTSWPPKKADMIWWVILGVVVAMLLVTLLI